MSTIKSKQLEGVHAEQLLDNFITATVDPTASNDSTQGYKPSSIWVNTTATPKRVFICSSNTVGAAVWVPVLDTMIGSNGIAAGVKGLVPQPAISDNTKFLKGDGTWTAIGGGVTQLDTTTLYVNHSTGNDTTGDGTSGTPWATVTKALSYLNDKTFKSDAVITIDVFGIGTYASPILVSHQQGNQIKIVENASSNVEYTPTVVAVGATTTYTIGTHSIAANDYVDIDMSGSIVANDIYRANGFYKVLSVVANTSITVAFNSSGYSTTVAGTNSIIHRKTVYLFDNTNGIVIESGTKLGHLEVRVYQTGTLSGNSKVGICIGNKDNSLSETNSVKNQKDSVLLGGDISVTKFSNGILIANSSSMSGCTITNANNNGDVGIWVTYSSSMSVCTITNANNNNNGILIAYSSSMSVCTITNANNNGDVGIWVIYSSSMSGCTITNANNNISHGVSVQSSSSMSVCTITNANNNNNGILIAYSSSMSGCTITNANNNGDIGIWVAYSSSMSNCNHTNANNNISHGVSVQSSSSMSGCTITNANNNNNAGVIIIRSSSMSECTITASGNVIYQIYITATATYSQCILTPAPTSTAWAKNE